MAEDRFTSSGGRGRERAFARSRGLIGGNLTRVTGGDVRKSRGNVSAARRDSERGRPTTFARGSGFRAR